VFFTLPRDARWNAERQALEFGVEIGEYRSVVRVPRARFPTPTGGAAPPPSGASKATTNSGPGSQSIAERKLRRRQVTDAGNVEISGP
jgi:hypothetical protein